MPKSRSSSAHAPTGSWRSDSALSSETRRIGQYAIFERLGAGGMGEVFRARHVNLKSDVAIKILKPDRLANDDSIDRFYQEMEAIGRIQSPHVVRALDAGEADGVHFLAMEYLEGVNLSETVQGRGHLLEPEAAELIRQAAVGLQAIHEHGLVHRDLKPSNLMLTQQGVVKILDLGLARLLYRSIGGDERTPTGQVMGTGDYMAPELAYGASSADIRSDIYSLGCTFYKLLGGRAPFDTPRFDTFARKVLAHCQTPVPPLPTRSDITDEIRAVIAKMVEKDPERRFQIPSEIIVALEPRSGCDVSAIIPETGRQTPSGSWSTPALSPDGSARNTVAATTRSLRPSRPGYFVAAFLAVAVTGVSLYFAGVFGGIGDKSDPADGVGHKTSAVTNVGKTRIAGLRRLQPLIFPRNLHSSWRTLDSGESLHVTSNGTAALAVGEWKEGDLSFEVDVRDNQGDGRVGIFFAFSEGDALETLGRFQTIELKPDGNGRVRLRRTWKHFGKSRPNKVSVDQEDITTKSFPLEARNRLGIRLSSKGLEIVTFNGEPVVELMLSDQKPLPGSFGVFVLRTSAAFAKCRVNGKPIRFESQSSE